MADFLLSVGVDVDLSFDQMKKDIGDLVGRLNQNPQRVQVGLEIDHSAIERFRAEIADIHNSMGGLGRVAVSPVDTSGLNNAVDGIARLSQNAQGAISTVQTMSAALNDVNTERIQQAIASINGISADGAAALAQSLGEANVRATEVRARLLEAADAEQLVALRVRGTNATTGHMVNYLMTYNAETGEIARRIVDVAARLEDASASEEHRATTVREISDLYRQMHALMRTNANASNTQSYAELANQARLLDDALRIARTESISIDEALTRLGTSGVNAISGARDAMSAFRLEMEQTGSSGTISLTTMYDTVAKMQTLLNNNAGYSNLPTYTNLQTQVNLLAQAIELASNDGITLEAALTRVGLNGSTAIHNAREAMSAFKAEMSGATTEEERLTGASVNYRVALDKINTLLRQVRANTEKWTAAKTGKSSEDYRVYADQARELENLAQRLSTGTMTMREFNAEYSRIKSTASNAETAIKGAGAATRTWTERIGGLASKFGTWFSITRVIMEAYRAIREMVSAVIELDTAMTELKKVTDETDATYEKFLSNAATRAKRLGASLTDVVKTSADFARLGLSLDDAETVSDAALVYKNVGDGIEDIDQASESLISTMQAFGIKAEDVMTIVDKFNVAGNNFAISSGGVGDALLNSASALAAANNTLDESIALITAANETIQNPEKVGKNLPNGTVMCRKKTAISVKGRRRLRPRKDFVVCARRVRSSTSFCYTPEVITMAKKTGVYTQCEYCGKTVYKTLSQYNNRKQHFCSNKCQSLLKREIAFEHRPCEVCGEDMYLSKKSTQRFCSTECQRTWQIGNTGFKNKRFQGGYVKCENCGNDFLLGKYRLELNTRHFCSTACRQTWYADVWSQSDEWRLESKERAANLLKDNPVVTQTKPQLITNSILDSLGITYRNEEVYTYYSLDNYLPEFDLAIEVMGDYWHSSPLKYPDTVNDRQRQVIARDKTKHTYIKKFYGIEILYLWESDILKRPDVCTKLIRHYIECGGSIQNYHSFNYSVVDGRLALNDVIVRPYQDGRTAIAC